MLRSCFELLEAGEYKKALRMATEAVKKNPESFEAQLCLGRVYLEMGDRESIAKALVSLAEAYQNIDEKEKALATLHEALKVVPEEKAGHIYNNMAVVYLEMEEFEEALECLHKALEISEKIQDQHGVAMCLLNLGDTYREVKNYQLAENYLLSGLDKVKSLKDKVGEAIAYEYLGDLYLDMGDKKRSLEYLKKAYKLYKSMGAMEDAEYLEEKILNLDVD
ncbi:MAG: tetratricopeptide repeat protein [Aquificaceae bacterium]